MATRRTTSTSHRTSRESVDAAVAEARRVQERQTIRPGHVKLSDVGDRAAARKRAVARKRAASNAVTSVLRFQHNTHAPHVMRSIHEFVGENMADTECIHLPEIAEMYCRYEGGFDNHPTPRRGDRQLTGIGCIVDEWVESAAQPQRMPHEFRCFGAQTPMQYADRSAAILLQIVGGGRVTEMVVSPKSLHIQVYNPTTNVWINLFDYLASVGRSSDVLKVIELYPYLQPISSS